jgi:hypothetical protein
MSYRLLNEGKAIQCLQCNRISEHPMDVQERFCERCNHFHLGEPEDEGDRPGTVHGNS